MERTEFKTLALIALLTVTVFVYFLLFTRSPRSSMNVIQVAAVIFFLICLIHVFKPAGGSDTDDYFQLSNWLVLIPLTLPALLYLPALNSYFLSDDFAHIINGQQPFWQNIWMLLAEGQSNTFFRPLGFMSLFLDVKLWDMNPFGYHLTNLSLHVFSILGVYCLCRLTLKDSFRSAVATTIFAVLPVHAETVVWISARFDLLAACLTIWSCVVYLLFRRSARQGFFFLSLLLALLALLSKENAYIIPVLILSVELIIQKTAKIIYVSAYLLLAVIVFIIRYVALSGIGGYATSSGDPAIYKFSLLTLQGLFIRGPGQIFLGFNWEHPFGVVHVFLISLALIVLLVVAFKVTLSRSNRRLVLMGLIWIFVTLVPAHFILLVGPGLTGSRVLYLGSVGFALVCGIVVTSSKSVRLSLALFVFLVISLSACLVHNNYAWKHAGLQARQALSDIKTQLPALSDSTDFVVWDMPETLNGAYFFREGLPDALRLLYGNRAISVEQKQRHKDTPADDRRGIELYWTGVQDRLIVIPPESR